MRLLKPLPPVARPVLVTLALVAAAYLAYGNTIFNPGPLHNAAGRAAPQGGVRSHADLANRCSACHAWPGSSTTMESLCLACHADIARQIDRQLPLHGRLSQAEGCLKCHVEHRGETASLTDWSRFDHNATAFPLTGRHRGLQCAACHKEQVYLGTPQSCVACHGEPEIHRGRFGLLCAQCHTTENWSEAVVSIEHHAFPIYHGGGKNRGRCSTCHNVMTDFRHYSCYGCHRHDPEQTAEKHLRWNVVELQGCARCHPTGRKRADQPPKKAASQ